MPIEYNKYKNRPTLKKGETAVYELSGLKKDPLDPKGGLAVPAMFGIPSTDRIAEGDDYIDIAHVTGYGVGGEPKTDQIVFLKSEAGLKTLNGGRASDQAKYEFFEKCNYNGSNPDRDVSVRVLFTRKNFKAEAKAKRDKRDEMVEALQKAKTIDVSHMRQIALGVGLGVSDDNGELRDKLEDYAEKNPRKFLAAIENKDLSIMEIGNEAQKKGKIVIDNQSRKITTAAGEILTTWAPEANVNPLEKFVAYVKSDNGSKFYAELKESLKEKKK